LNEGDVLALFESCSNAGRWGADDERGTLNYVTAEKTLAALRSVRCGRVVSVGRDLPTRGSPRPGTPNAVHFMRYLRHGLSSQDVLTVSPHGFDVTHVDALAHVFYEGAVYNDRRADEVVDDGGVTFGSIEAYRDGIVTRGVLLDVPAARGIEHLRPGDGIGVADLEAAEALAGTRVEEGDALVLRSGLDLREAREGWSGDSPREGVLAEVMPWLHERRVAVFGADCIERLPSGYERVPMPLHQVGLTAMGLCILDCVDTEALRALCAEEGRSDFLLVVAPLRLPGGTASAVNPLAVF
jgi:kynurenine formamidase